MNHAAPHHRWLVTPEEAIAIQEALCSMVDQRWDGRRVEFVAGVDCAYTPEGDGFAAAVVMSWPDLAFIEEAHARGRTTFPYTPGLFAFREIPLLLAAWRDLCRKPDLLFVDGQGIAHPRSLGIASHLGLLLDTPTIGLAKTPLVGEYREVGRRRGDWAPLIDRGRVVGAAVRTREGTRPIIVSPGHLIGLQEAIEWSVTACKGLRTAEPLRQAHILANRCKRAFSA